MNQEQVAKLVVLTAALWTNFGVTEHTVPAWTLVLGDVDYDAAKAAVLQLQTQGKEFAPTPGQIRLAALKSLGVTSPDPDAAFDELMSGVRSNGWVHGEPEWSHPVLGDCVRALGGWMEVCGSTNPEALRAHFRQAYASASERRDREALATPAARAALENARAALPIIELPRVEEA